MGAGRRIKLFACVTPQGRYGCFNALLRRAARLIAPLDSCDGIKSMGFARRQLVRAQGIIDLRKRQFIFVHIFCPIVSVKQVRSML